MCGLEHGKCASSSENESKMTMKKVRTVAPTFPSLSMRMLQMWHLRLELHRHRDHQRLTLRMLRRYRHD